MKYVSGDKIIKNNSTIEMIERRDELFCDERWVVRRTWKRPWFLGGAWRIEHDFLFVSQLEEMLMNGWDLYPVERTSVDEPPPAAK